MMPGVLLFGRPVGRCVDARSSRWEEVLRACKEQNKLHGVDSSSALTTGRYVPCLRECNIACHAAEGDRPKVLSFAYFLRRNGSRWEKSWLIREWWRETRALLETNLPQAIAVRGARRGRSGLAAGRYKGGPGQAWGCRPTRPGL